MKNKYIFVLLLLVCVLAGSVGLTMLYTVAEGQPEDEEGTVIVTSFYPMYIAALNVVGNIQGVTLENLSEPQTGCLHDFQLTPEDMKLLSQADVFIVNGGGIESFLEDVADAYPELSIVEACQNLDLLEDDGEENAHAWMSIAAYRTQIATIASQLVELDPDHAAIYLANAQDYDEKLSELGNQMEQITYMAEGENVILFHEAYDYIADDLNLNVSYVLDLDEERQVSAGEIADVLSAIEDDGVDYILAEELYGKSMGDTVQKETEVQILYLDPLTRGEYDPDAYLDGMQENIELLKNAFGG